MDLSQVQAVVEFVCVLFAWRYWRKYWAFIASLVVWLPVLWLTPRNFHPHSVWEHRVWLPCAIPAIILQGLASLEALFRVAGKDAPRVSRAMAFVAIPFVFAVVRLPSGTALQQIVEAARWQQVACFAFLAGCVTFFAIQRTRVLKTSEGAHMMLLCAWMGVNMARSLMSPLATWEAELSRAWPFEVCTVILLLWIMLFRPATSVASGTTRFLSAVR